MYSELSLNKDMWSALQVATRGWKLLKWKEGGEEQGGRITVSKWPLLLETLQEFTMGSVTASRVLDLFAVLSLLPLLIYANRIITDTPDRHKSTSTGKQVTHESGVHEGQQSRRGIAVQDELHQHAHCWIESRHLFLVYVRVKSSRPKSKRIQFYKWKFLNYCVCSQVAIIQTADSSGLS